MTAISIIIPCYNEENNLKRGVLNEVDDYLKTTDFTYEVLVCNDRSTDDSFQLVKEFIATHPHFTLLDLPKGGKPGAIWGGIQSARYPFILFTDMDQSTPLKELEKFIPYFEQNYDIVIGSRGRDRQGNSVLRQLGSKVFATARNILLQSNITDTQCGFKAMKLDLAKKIFPELAVIKNIQNGAGWRVSAFDVELLFIAQKMGKKIKEVEVDWKNEDTSNTKGDANARYIKESRQMANEVWRIFVNNLKGLYDQKN